MNLDLYGGAYRCLLRLHENEGHPVMSGQTFERSFLSGKSSFSEHLGWSSLAIRDLASSMGLAVALQESSDYEQVLMEHRAGQAILLRLDEASLALHSFGDSALRTTLLEDMDEQGFQVWCPMRNDSWELLPRIPRSRWLETQAIGISLIKTKTTAPTDEAVCQGAGAGL